MTAATATQLAAKYAVGYGGSGPKGTECWIWLAAQNGRGYGSTKVGRAMRLAHRVSYEAHVGPIPAGLTIDHLCRNRACVNPDHLEPVTMAENNARSNSRSAMLARKTECIRGHAFTPGNTARIGTARRCRECAALRMRAWRDKRQAARGIA